MDEAALRELLDAVKAGAVSADDAVVVQRIDFVVPRPRAVQTQPFHRRYASGEITREQYEQMRRDLQP